MCFEVVVFLSLKKKCLWTRNKPILQGIFSNDLKTISLQLNHHPTLETLIVLKESLFLSRDGATESVFSHNSFVFPYLSWYSFLFLF